ncbi:MAG TPA: PAS domain S-box protein, partial [Agriterribacter sp.]|nr:PAS domain S-box protein [Agriterribacter sp.]
MKEYTISTYKIVIIFLIVSLTWMIVIDYLLLRVFGDNLDLYHFFQSLKGIIFAIINAAAVYLIIRRDNKYFKQNQDVLAFGTTELHGILEEIEYGIARLSRDGRFLYANPFFCRLTGYCLKEIMQKHFSFIIKSKDNVELEYWDMLLTQGKLNRMKNLAGITTKTEEKLICNVSVHEVQNAVLGLNYVLMVENVTNSREEKKKLEESLKRYNILSMATMEGLWDWNMLTGQLYYNSNIKLLFGFDDAELQKGYTWWESNIHPDDKDKILTKMDMTLQLAHVTTMKNEYRFACNDGSYKTITDCFSILRDTEGRPFRLIVSMHDVTEQRHLQKQVAAKEIIYRRQLARTVMDAQESERRKLAEELHDNVNQLLGVVKLYIEHSIANSDVRDSLLKKCNEYIDRVIEELRNLSKNLAPP